MPVDLTIWKIAPYVMDLLIRREEATTDEEREAAQQDLTVYIKQQMTPNLVSEIRGALKHCELMAAAADAECKAQHKRAEQWEGRKERLKEVCQGLMEEAGIKRLEGNTGGLKIVGNGGKAPVVITDLSLVPDEYVKYEGTISWKAWRAFRECMALVDKREFQYWEGREEIQMERVPLKNAIHADLEKGIPVPGCHLGERGQTLRVE